MISVDFKRIACHLQNKRYVRLLRMSNVQLISEGNRVKLYNTGEDDLVMKLKLTAFLLWDWVDNESHWQLPKPSLHTTNY